MHNRRINNKCLSMYPKYIQKTWTPTCARPFLEVLEYPGQQTEKMVPTLQKNYNPEMCVRWVQNTTLTHPGYNSELYPQQHFYPCVLADQMKFSRFQEAKRQSVSDAFYICFMSKPELKHINATHSDLCFANLWKKPFDVRNW